MALSILGFLSHPWTAVVMVLPFATRSSQRLSLAFWEHTLSRYDVACDQGLLADERCTHSVMDFLHTRKVGCRVGPYAVPQKPGGDRTVGVGQGEEEELFFLFNHTRIQPI